MTERTFRFTTDNGAVIDFIVNPDPVQPGMPYGNTMIEGRYFGDPQYLRKSEAADLIDHFLQIGAEDITGSKARDRDERRQEGASAMNLPRYGQLDMRIDRVVWCTDDCGDYSENPSRIVLTVLARHDARCDIVAAAMRKAADIIEGAAAEGVTTVNEWNPGG